MVLVTHYLSIKCMFVYSLGLIAEVFCGPSLSNFCMSFFPTTLKSRYLRYLTIPTPHWSSIFSNSGSRVAHVVGCRVAAPLTPPKQPVRRGLRYSVLDHNV